MDALCQPSRSQGEGVRAVRSTTRVASSATCSHLRCWSQRPRYADMASTSSGLAAGS